MKGLSLFRIALLAVFVSAWQFPAHAQAGPTPKQIQAMIAGGQERAALADLKPILRAHPHSGVAWYLTAEAQDASGNRAAARDALARAEQYSPGLPFAQPGRVAALKAHLAAPAAPVARHRSGFGPAIIVIGALVVLFLLVRMVFRSRRRMPPPGYGTGFPGGPGMPYGPGGAPYGTGVGPAGSGIGSSIASGLAAGAGFAAGERIIDGLTGGPRGETPLDPSSNDPMPAPDRDDGLLGSPDWGNDSSGQDDGLDNGGGFDPDDKW
ncbi:MAG TPA: tetratricopeptide repeat-containing protein [Acetobacteraceae bacterium]|nr:tetratricopeptide repeat-containing protein [Acetobacteraceae bacterium]